jgi:hypothetical protein
MHKPAQKSALCFLEDTNFTSVMLKVQEKVTGILDNYQFLNPNTFYNQLWCVLPTPIGTVFLSHLISYQTYNNNADTQSDIFLQHLSLLGNTDLKEALAKIQGKIQLQTYLCSMELHQWNDAYALLADQDNPFIPVFIPNKIINCKGIKTIDDDTVLKNDFLKSVNHHLTLSPKERAEYLESYSIVRKITEKDCKHANLSKILVGQNGVFARVDLPKYSFLGFYSGFYFASKEEAEAYFKKNDFCGIGIEIYLFAHANQEFPLVSAYRSGNRISLINSATDYNGTAHDIAHQLFYTQNTASVSFKTDNNPVIDIRDSDTMYDINGYVAIKDIQAGEQLFVDYGYDYWKNRHCYSFSNKNDFTYATSQEIDDIYFALKKNIS